MSGSGLSRTLLALLAAVLLSACAQLQTYLGQEVGPSPQRDREAGAALRIQLAAAPACCSSLADLPYQDIPKEGVLAVEIRSSSPAFVFEGGKSFFAAFQLDKIQRPFLLEVASVRSVPAIGDDEATTEVSELVFAPALLLLDSNFNVRKSVSSSVPLEGGGDDKSEDVYLLTLDIFEPSDESKYLVVLTTDTLLAMEKVSARGGRHAAPSPVGKIVVRTYGLPLDDGPLRLKTPAKPYPSSRAPSRDGALADLYGATLVVPFLQEVYKWVVVPFEEPGLLVLGNKAVHFLKETKDFRYAKQLSIPYDTITRVHASGDTLEVGVQPTAGSDSKRHSFEIGDFRGRGYVAAAVVAEELLKQKLEKVAFVLTMREPPLELAEDESTAAKRIGGAALTGGGAVAFPCALCQLGGCTPEMLLACSGLFAVGAVAGGLVGVGQELLSQGAVPPGVPLDGLRVMLERAQKNELCQSALMACLRQTLDEKHAVGPDVGQRYGGRSWVSGAGASEGESRKLDDELVARGYQYRVEVDVSRIALVPEGTRGRILPGVRACLVLESEIRFRRLSRPGRPASWSTKVTWRGAPHGVGEWLEVGSGLATKAMKDGCQGLSKQILDAGLSIMR